MSLSVHAIDSFAVAGSAVALTGLVTQGGFNWYMASQTVRRLRKMYARIPIDNGDILRIRGKDTAWVLEDPLS